MSDQPFVIVLDWSVCWLCPCRDKVNKDVILPLWRFKSRSISDKPVFAQPDSMQVGSVYQNGAVLGRVSC